MPSVSSRNTNHLFGGGTSINIEIGTNTSANVLIAGAVFMSSTSASPPSFNTPSGWTEIINAPASNNLCIALFRKTGDGSTSVTITADRVSDGLLAGSLVLNDADITSPVDASGTKVNSGSSHLIPSIALTTTVPNELLLAFWGFYDTPAVGNSYTPPGDMTLEFTNQTGIITEFTWHIVNLLCSTVTQAAAGSTGFKSVNSNTSYIAQSVGALVAIKPYPGPSVPVLTYPNGGESLTAGSTVTITWNPSTSPSAYSTT